MKRKTAKLQIEFIVQGLETTQFYLEDYVLLMKMEN